MRRGNGRYSSEFRESVVAEYRRNTTATYEEIAREFGCAAESVRRWVRAAGQQADQVRPTGTSNSSPDWVHHALWVVEGEIALMKASLEASERMLTGLRRKHGVEYPDQVPDEPLIEF